MEKEIFKDVPNYEGRYQISNLGRVKSLPKEWVNGFGGVNSHNGKILKLSLGSHGYLHVNLCNEGKMKTIQIHQLVAITFLNHERCGHKLVVDHKDNNPLNNRLENLQLLSNRENTSKDRGGSSKYTGVAWDKNRNKWQSRIIINGKAKYLGSFDLEEEASEYYQDALKSLENNTEIKVKEVAFSSKYKGVCWDKNGNKWKSQIIINGKIKYLGSFNCELPAAAAYQKALLKVEL